MEEASRKLREATAADDQATEELSKEQKSTFLIRVLLLHDVE